jgi:prolyl-tRNA synthetase
MKDLYSFHVSQEDLDVYYEKVKQAYFNIYKRLGLGEITHLTYSSGGAFSKYSHEFQTVCSAGEDLIYVCQKCKTAINREIIEEQKDCPECGGHDFKEEKAIEVGNIFKLGTKFSKPFGFQYKNQSGDIGDIIMGCYGMGPSRILGTIVEVYHDDRGIIWPESIAPFSIHLISLKQNNEAEKIYQDLISSGFDVLYDDRNEISAGEKFADADLIGCPIRLVLSAKTLSDNKVEIKLRKKDDIEMIKIKDLITYLKDRL